MPQKFYSWETRTNVHQRAHTWMLIEAPFTIVPNQKQASCSSAVERKNCTIFRPQNITKQWKRVNLANCNNMSEPTGTMISRQTYLWNRVRMNVKNRSNQSRVKDDRREVAHGRQWVLARMGHSEASGWWKCSVSISPIVITWMWIYLKIHQAVGLRFVFSM